MASSVEIAVPTTSTSTTSKPYTIYNITLRQPLRSYNVQKRYSDFAKLHAAITSQCSNQPPPEPLPSKSWIRKTVSSPELTEERRKGLEAYLQAINRSADSRWRNSEAWRQFLNIKPGIGNSAKRGAGGQAAIAATRATDLQSQIVDPNVWLDIYRELKSQLGDAKLALRRRTDASTAQAQHESSAEAKRYLVRSGTTIAALESGLQRLSEVSQEPKKAKGTNADELWTSKLGEGEIRRRRDLLSAAKKERAGLETQLTSLAAASRGSDGPTASAMPTEEQKSNLMSASSSRANSTNHIPRRVLGGQIKETERTRELDNEGVLQLQKQIIQDQDEDLTEFTKTVRRMKDMGIQINEELESQIQLLNMLDQDVDRVQDKVDIARKRADKIK